MLPTNAISPTAGGDRPAEPDAAPPDEPPRRRLRPRHEGARLLAFFFALLPGGLVAYFGLTAGGYFPASTGAAAVFLAVLLGLRVLLLPAPTLAFTRGLAIACAAMGAFVLWTYASQEWSGSAARATLAADRALVYFLALVLFGSFPAELRRLRWMLRWIALAIVVVCAVGVVSRLLPGVIEAPSGGLTEDRLGYPLTYWNGLGILAAIGAIFCVHLTKSASETKLVRSLAAAAVPLLATTVWLTLSRGAIVAGGAGLLVYLVLARREGTLPLLLATVPASVVAVLAARGEPILTGVDHASRAGVAAGRGVALVLVACIAAAGAIRLVLAGLERPLRLETPLTRAAPQTRIALGVAAGAIAVAAVAVVAGSRIASAWNEFFYGPPAFQAGQERLGSASGGGRTELWDVGLTTFGEHPLTGTGAGTWALEWRREGVPGLIAENAHSLYVEVMSDLGLVGIALLAVVLGLIIVGFAARIRGSSRSLYAALLAAALAWALHNAVDWDWELPATTIWLFALGGAALAAAPPRRTTRSFFSAAYTGRLHLDRQGILRVAVALACLALAIVPARVTASQLRLDRAVERYREDDCRRAQAHASSALAAAWWRTEALTILTYCAIDRDDGDAAVSAARQALAADPDNPELSFAYATALAADGRDPTQAATRAVRGQRRSALFVEWRERFATAGSPAQLRALARRAPRIDVDPGTPSRTSVERPLPRPGAGRPAPGARLRPPGAPQVPAPGQPRLPGQPAPIQPVGPGGVPPQRRPAPGAPAPPSRPPAPRQLPPQQVPQQQP